MSRINLSDEIINTQSNNRLATPQFGNGQQADKIKRKVFVAIFEIENYSLYSSLTMSNSKPLPPFTFEVLCYLNRDQLERFSIVCCPLKNIIDRYFHSKPYRIFDQLYIRGGSYFLCHNGVRWHPDRDDYNHNAEYSFAEMLPYLGPTVRIKETIINVFISNFYSPKYIAEMESIAYLWRDYRISIWNHRYDRIVAEDIQRILNSPTILQCRKLCLYNARFSFKDYQVLYSVKEIELRYNQKVETYYNTHGYNIDEIDLLQQYWHQFLEQPRVKPLVVFRFLRYSNLSRKNIDNLLSRLFKLAIRPLAAGTQLELTQLDAHILTRQAQLLSATSQRIQSQANTQLPPDAPAYQTTTSSKPLSP
ncbi:hypothetical protein DdX_17636 [Ditylenchus destructor]|uniref:F-box domain-containing protein n=1 Tax=Ditylenchus destructor TaxID=166010 RepID=A0AAD4MN46_9BILA|nr:hypothetical protein DdX_17636 [Ditylenchus destructor]